MLEISVLGPLEVRSHGRQADIAGGRDLRALATLSLAEGRTVSVPRLVDCVWSERTPRTATAQLQTVVWRLRGALAAVGQASDVIVRQPNAYRLRAECYVTDVAAYRGDVAAAREELGRGRVTAATDRLRSALARWRGPALGGLTGGLLTASVERLEEERLRAWEQCLRLEVVLGRCHAVNLEARELVRVHPLRESPHRTLAVSLYRSGRQGDALAVLRQLRERLREELGVDPCVESRSLELAILRQELAFPARGTMLELRRIQRALEG